MNRSRLAAFSCAPQVLGLQFDFNSLTRALAKPEDKLRYMPVQRVNEL